MASFIDKMDVRTAITDNTKLDLGHQHITTTNFMQLTPVLCKEMVPGERCDVNLMTFAKLQPLAVPTFGRANIKERAFFVPMRTIFRGWNDFITDTPHVYSGCKDDSAVNYPTVPTISNSVLAYFFLRDSVYLSGSTSAVSTSVNNPTDGNYDICGYRNGSTYNGVTYRVLSKDGKQCLKILESLGYKIVFDERNRDQYSALPLLAVAKVYCDWYFPNQYVNTDIYAAIMGLLNYDGQEQYSLSSNQLTKILGWISYANFDADYFVNAWDNPVSPSNGVYSQFNMIDITTTGASPTGYGVDNDWYHPFNSTTGVISRIGVGNVATNGTPTTVMKISPTGTGSTVDRLGMSVSDYQHKALTALTDYMKRHQLVGARAMDRYLARFGKKLNVEQLNRCNYIGSKMIPLEVGEVMSNSNASATSSVGGLGEFAGKGQAFEKNFSFDWSTDEYGFLIVMSSLIPAAGIYQGLDRKVMHISRTDFWTPEFDNLGVQAISTRELYNNYSYAYLSNSDSSYMAFNNTVFGFAPRYGEYKYAKDQLTGDFVLMSQQPVESNASENAWHLFRTFSDRSFYDTTTSTYSFSNLVHSRNFMSGIRDNDQFSRIFTYSPWSDNPMSQSDFYVPDPVTMIYDFQMVSFAPMKPLYETYDFEDKGQKVVEQAGGVKVN
jgi:hypothetical protein